MSFYRNEIADSAGFEILGTQFGSDVELALKTAIAGGAVFPKAGEPLSIFREALMASTRPIESHSMGMLFQEFLSKGPYEDAGAIPAELASSRLSDYDTARAITFISSHMVPSFKAAITEMLSVPAILRLIKMLQRKGDLAINARLYVGEAVGVHRVGGRVSQGAGLYILTEDRKADWPQNINLAGVVNVALYYKSMRRVREQLRQHIRLAKRGIRVCGADYPAKQVSVGYGKKRRALLIAVQPNDLKLPQRYYTESSHRSTSLDVYPSIPPFNKDRIVQASANEWMIKLRWQKEILNAAAYEMSFWYMEKVGQAIFSRKIPKGLEDMTPAEAGRNVLKMMLYRAILRCRSVAEEIRATTLYNTYSFGYGIGMNAVDLSDKRKMLWPEDFDGIDKEVP